MNDAGAWAGWTLISGCAFVAGFFATLLCRRYKVVRR